MAQLALNILDTFVAKHSGDREVASVTICGNLYMKRVGSPYVKSLAQLRDEYGDASPAGSITSPQDLYLWSE